jgi:membrane associated rhomboid family serine protease
MFIPLHDDTPLRLIRFQFVTLSIIVLNVAVYLWTGAFTNPAYLAGVNSSFGLTPSHFISFVQATPAGTPVVAPLTLVTSLFIHASWMHLIGNMLFLWVFADNIEDVYGYVGFAVFYLLSGIFGGLLHVVMMPHSVQPLIGASGAVSGVLAAYVVLFPRARVWILLFMRIPVPLPAIWVLGGWFLLQVFSLAAAQPGQDIAWWDHIGGFAFGLVLTYFLQGILRGRTGRRI